MAKRSSKAVVGAYSLYKAVGKQKSNRTRKLQKQLKLQPNNEQVSKALLNVGYRRKTPNNSQWSSTSRHYAQLLASVVPDRTKVTLKGMFSIETRARIVTNG